MARRDLLVDSAYPMPWIIYKKEYSLNVAQYGEVRNATLAHNLPFTPLIFGQWSDKPNFSPSYDLAVNIPGGSSGGQPETVVNVSANATNIVFLIINNKASSRRFYFRLMAFSPPDYAGEVDLVDYNSKFRFNSHYRYEQLYMAGRSNGIAVQHGLGYLPKAKVWAITTADGSVVPAHGVLTNTAINTAYSNVPFYYHIYRGAFDD